MARKPESKLTDLEICKNKIEALLKEFNCYLDHDDRGCYLIDKDTKESTGVESNSWFGL